MSKRYKELNKEVSARVENGKYDFNENKKYFSVSFVFSTGMPRIREPGVTFIFIQTVWFLGSTRNIVNIENGTGDESHGLAKGNQSKSQAEQRADSNAKGTLTEALQGEIESKGTKIKRKFFANSPPRCTNLRNSHTGIINQRVVFWNNL